MCMRRSSIWSCFIRVVIFLSHTTKLSIPFLLRNFFLVIMQVVRLHDVFPHGSGFVLVFEYMLSDLSEVIRNSDRPLTDGQIKSYMMMLLKGVAFCHQNHIMHRVSFVHYIYLYVYCTLFIVYNYLCYNLVI